jgi:GPH family glycoside/pentoside/hexuronide:cation symporter
MVPLVLEFTGYRPNIAEQAPAVLLGLRILMGPIPAVLLCLGILSAFRYPLTREQHAEIVRELEERRIQSGGSA